MNFIGYTFFLSLMFLANIKGSEKKELTLKQRIAMTNVVIKHLTDSEILKCYLSIIATAIKNKTSVRDLCAVIHDIQGKITTEKNNLSEMMSLKDRKYYTAEKIEDQNKKINNLEKELENYTDQLHTLLLQIDI